MTLISYILLLLVSYSPIRALESNFSATPTKISIKNQGDISVLIPKCPRSDLKETITICPYLSTTSSPLNFRFKEYKVNCALGYTKLIQIPIKSKSNNTNELAPFQFNPAGVIESYKIDGDMDKTIRDFCIHNMTDELLDVWVCFANCDLPTLACIPKCCPVGQIFDESSSECVGDAGIYWKPRLHNNDETLSPLPPFANIERIFVPMLDYCTPAHGTPLITTDQSFIASRIEIRLLQTGRLMMLINSAPQLTEANPSNLIQNGWQDYEDPFCMDGILNSTENVLLDLDCSDAPITGLGDFNMWGFSNVSSADHYNKQGEIQNVKTVLNLVHGSLMVVSALFLLVSAAIYIALWDKQNTHGWTVLSYIVSLLIAYICLAIYKLNSATMAYIPKTTTFLCILNGILAHFFFTSVFTWLTVINFDIWWKFWDLKAKPIKAKEPLKFAMYALFAFGFPLVIVIVGLSIGAITSNEKNPTMIAPAYGRRGSCFLQAKALGVYLYYPIGFLIGVNIIFFGFTITKIIEHFRSTTHLHSDKEEQEFESAKVIVKLFVVMGVTWIFEFLSFLFLPYQQNTTGMVLWGICDCFNILQSLGIFYIFIWKRLILNQLSTKYPRLRPILKSLKGAPGCRKKIDYRSSSRLTTKSTNKTSITVGIGNKNSLKNQSDRTRKLSSESDCGTTSVTTFETIELA